MTHDESPSHEIPKADDATDHSADPQSSLNLSPPGDSGDILVDDVVAAVEFTYANGSKCFILFTKKGLRMAPVNPANRAILTTLVGSILAWDSWAKDACSDGLAGVLGDAASDGVLKTAYMVKDAGDMEWLIVSVDGRAIACEFSNERFDLLHASEFHIENKLKPPKGLVLTI